MPKIENPSNLKNTLDFISLHPKFSIFVHHGKKKRVTSNLFKVTSILDFYSGVGQSGVPGGLITLRSEEIAPKGAVAEFKSSPRYFYFLLKTV